MWRWNFDETLGLAVQTARLKLDEACRIANRSHDRVNVAFVLLFLIPLP